MRVAGTAEVDIPRVEVSIEVNQRQGPEARSRRAQQWQCDGVVAAERYQVGRPLAGCPGRFFDLTDRLLDAERSAGDVACIGHLMSERFGVGPGVEWTEHLRPGPDGAGPEAGTGPVHDAGAERNAENRDLGIADRIHTLQPAKRGWTREPRHLHRGDRTGDRFVAPTHSLQS